MSEPSFSEQRWASRSPGTGRATLDSAVSIDSDGATDVIRALQSVFALGKLTRAERDALRIFVARYMRAVRRRDVPPERALVFVKVLAQRAQSAQDWFDVTTVAAAGQVDVLRMFDCREYYDELTRQISEWAIEAYFSPERTD